MSSSLHLCLRIISWSTKRWWKPSMAHRDPWSNQVTLPPNLGRSQSLDAVLWKLHLCRVWMDKSNLLKQQISIYINTKNKLNEAPIFTESAFPVSPTWFWTWIINHKTTSSYHDLNSLGKGGLILVLQVAWSRQLKLGINKMPKYDEHINFSAFPAFKPP